jgi:hypothetical protein
VKDLQGVNKTQHVEKKPHSPGVKSNKERFTLLLDYMKDATTFYIDNYDSSLKRMGTDNDKTLALAEKIQTELKHFDLYREDNFHQDMNMLGNLKAMLVSHMRQTGETQFKSIVREAIQNYLVNSGEREANSQNLNSNEPVSETSVSDKTLENQENDSDLRKSPQP